MQTATVLIIFRILQEFQWLFDQGISNPCRMWAPILPLGIGYDLAHIKKPGGTDQNWESSAKSYP